MFYCLFFISRVDGYLYLALFVKFSHHHEKINVKVVEKNFDNGISEKKFSFLTTF